MKIICTVTNDLTYDRRMHRICSSLQNNGYEVTLVGRQLKESKPLTPYHFQQKRLSCFFNRGKFFYLEYNIRLFFYLLSTSFDVVCSVDLDTILAGYFTARLKNKKCLYDAHEYFTEVPEVIDRPATKRIWEIVANAIIPRVYAAYTVSNSIAIAFSKMYQIDFKVVRNVPFQYAPINKADLNAIIEKYNLFTNASVRTLLYQGALNDGRGIEELIDAMLDLENYQLWIAGEGDLSQLLREKVNTLHLKDKIQFLGFVQPADLILITRLADIGLNLLQNKGLSYYYSLANKTFDYIQSEIPAIHMAFPEYEYLNEAYGIGILIPNLETPTIRNAIQSLENPVTYQSIVDNCKKAKAILHWEAEEKILLEIYKSSTGF
jgi:glycosyltransferase involved in cell wall biosynthesis